MAKIEQANAFLELKQRTNRDVRQLGPLVSQFYEAESTASQTVINLNFAVEQTAEAKRSVQVYVDGSLLREGSGNDYTYSSISSGQSSQITLSAPIAAGLNILAYRIGTSIQNFPTPASVQASLNSDVNQPHLMAQAGFQNFIAPIYRSVPFTAIVNRAQILDESQSLKAIAGVERIHIRGLNLLQGEFGSSGERVWEADNKDARIRLVGSGWRSYSDASASRPGTTTVGDYSEITFYGTGLNYLSITASSLDVRASVDGGSEGSNLYTGFSTILNGRNYCPNVVIPVISGLTLGWHTVKIRNNNVAGTDVCGFEIINERSNLAVLPGTAFNGAKRELLSGTSTSAFNAEVVGTRGARVIKYIKDGAIAQVVQEVNASAAYLSSSDHTNEEAVRRINWREFGANRADDFSTLTTARASVFTLDDGTTTLVASNALVSSESLRFSVANGNFTTITFVGTGLDIITRDDASGTSATDTFDASVNGVSIGNYTTVGSTSVTTRKIVSGLPYGTHTVRFTRTNAPSAWNSQIQDFIIYQPKKPAIPSGAVEICDYNVPANFAVGTVGVNNLSTGILKKTNTRELTYVEGTGGTTNWTAGLDAISEVSGFSITSDRLNAYVEYTFFGTGVDFRYFAATNRSTNIAVTLNGTSATTTNFPTATFSQYGIGSYNSGTAVLSQNGTNTPGSGLRISGLPLGLYRIRLNNGTASTFISTSSFDIITPIHYQAPSLKIGSLSLISNRNFDIVKPTIDLLPDLGKAKAWALFDMSTNIIRASFGISAILRTATGSIIIYFEKPFKSINYTTVATSNFGESVVSNGGRTPGYVVVSSSNSAGTASDSVISIVLFGELIDE